MERLRHTSNLYIVLGDGIDATITENCFLDARELRIRFDSMYEVDRLIRALEKHTRRVERGECIG